MRDGDEERVGFTHEFEFDGRAWDRQEILARIAADAKVQVAEKVCAVAVLAIAVAIPLVVLAILHG